MLAGLEVSGAGVSVVKSLALELGVSAQLVGVVAMFISLIILKTSHNSTCDNLSNPLILTSNYSESKKVYKATPDVVLDMLPGRVFV